LEGFRNPFPLPWTLFNAIKMDRKTLTAELICQQMSWHSHMSPKPIEYFLDPPPVPLEEDVPERTPGEEPANSETASVDTASPRSPRSRQPARSKKAANQAAKKRPARSPATQLQHFLPSQSMPMGFGQDAGMMPQTSGN
jgi:mediator of RNA polymerase II transcription subunit 12